MLFQHPRIMKLIEPLRTPRAQSLRGSKSFYAFFQQTGWKKEVLLRRTASQIDNILFNLFGLGSS
jgi:hypothetical protein